MQNKTTDELAIILWDYMLLHEVPQQSDGIICLGSHDTRVAERASELLLQGIANYIVFSGGLGRLTQDVFEETEAEKFAKIAVALGVPKEKIFVENKSTNTGENILFTYALLQVAHLPHNSLILVQKPYMERRTYATFMKNWPENTTKATVTSPQLDFYEYINQVIRKNDVINIMVGDLQRIKEYPALGYQIEQDIPNKVWEAYLELVNRGFNKHLINS